MTMVSFAIVAYRSSRTIAALLDSIARQTGDFRREIIVVDNSPQESCADIVCKYPQARYVLNPVNTGYTAGMNQALSLATGDFLFLLNPDVDLQLECTAKLLDALASDRQTWAAAPQLLNHDGSIQFSVRNFPHFSTLIWDLKGFSRLFPKNRTFGHWRNLYFDHQTRTFVQQPMASAFLIKREVLKSVGPLDEQFFVFFSDVDYCKRIHDAGGKILFMPEARATHEIGGSTKQEGTWLIRDSHAGFYRYLAKHELVGFSLLLRPVAAIILAVGAVLRIAARTIRGGSFKQ
jgi:O-antigen biosynthesis protein